MLESLKLSHSGGLASWDLMAWTWVSRADNLFDTFMKTSIWYWVQIRSEPHEITSRCWRLYNISITDETYLKPPFNGLEHIVKLGEILLVAFLKFVEINLVAFDKVFKRSWTLLALWSANPSLLAAIIISTTTDDKSYRSGGMKDIGLLLSVCPCDLGTAGLKEDFASVLWASSCLPPHRNGKKRSELDLGVGLVQFLAAIPYNKGKISTLVCFWYFGRNFAS